jgi:hypothetical protein
MRFDKLENKTRIIIGTERGGERHVAGFFTSRAEPLTMTGMEDIPNCGDILFF